MKKDGCRGAFNDRLLFTASIFFKRSIQTAAIEKKTRIENKPASEFLFIHYAIAVTRATSRKEDK